VSRAVEVKDENNARLIGDLTIRDITRPVVLDVEFLGQAKSPWGTTSFGFAADTKISRKDWNLTWNVALETGGMLVGDEIKISIELELVKTAEPEAMAA
jgi:polyisoprenoid-binding protein YceI